MNFTTFGIESNETQATGTVESLGGKGMGLVWMSKNNIPVPPGFIIPIEVWAAYSKAPKETMANIAAALPQYLESLKKHFGSMPLVSVRSGSRVSCPGMMDTILNVGIDQTNAYLWEQSLGHECFRSSYQRLITMYGSVVCGYNRHELEAGTLEQTRATYFANAKENFPDAQTQILNSIEAVFKSWDNTRAADYRKQHGVPYEYGTAVIIQAMVFGNLGNTSATGVLFTRNPDTGAKGIKGEFLINAQGEDVVAGIRTPQDLKDMANWDSAMYINLVETCLNIETSRREMQDIEFTIQNGSLYILQIRNGKRSAPAAVKIAMDMVNEGLISKLEAVKKVSAKQLDMANLPQLDPAFTTPANFKGIGASSGIVTGIPVFSAISAINCKVPCILITKETTPEDYAGMLASVGIITLEGGMTAHAAVVARGESKPCIVGVGGEISNFEVPMISMDGATGRIWLGEVKVLDVAENTLLDEYKDLVCEMTDTIPVITSVPTRKYKRAMLALDTTLTPDKFALEVAKAATMVETLYVDLQETEGAEQIFYGMFSDATRIQRAIESLNALAQDQTFLFKDDYKRVVIFTDQDTGIFTRLQGPHSLTSFLMMKLCRVDMISDSAGVIEKMVRMKKADGDICVTIGKRMADATAIMTTEQAINEWKGN